MPDPNQSMQDAMGLSDGDLPWGPAAPIEDVAPPWDDDIPAPWELPESQNDGGSSTGRAPSEEMPKEEVGSSPAPSVFTLTACEGCKKGFKPGGFIKGTNLCGTCYRANLMGMNDPEKFCQEHVLIDGRFRVGECPACKPVESGSGPGPGDDHGSGERDGPGKEAPPEVKDSDVKLEVECPACGAHKFCRQEDRPTQCDVCAESRIIMRTCGTTWPEFDYARLLADIGERKALQEPAMCLLCGSALGIGRIVYVAPRCSRTVIEARCMEDELGPELPYFQTRDCMLTAVTDHVIVCSLCNATIRKGDGYLGHPEVPGRFAHAKCVDPSLSLPIQEKDPRDPCEWHPKANRASEVGDPFHARATVLVGSGKNQARLCGRCRYTPAWVRKRKVVQLEAKI